MWSFEDMLGPYIVADQHPQMLVPATQQDFRPGAELNYPFEEGVGVGPLVNEAITRRFVSQNIGRPWKADNAKSVRELGMSYRPLEETFTEHFQQLADAGLVTV